jgi:hypothetical protein
MYGKDILYWMTPAIWVGLAVIAIALLIESASLF